MVNPVKRSARSQVMRRSSAAFRTIRLKARHASPGGCRLVGDGVKGAGEPCASGARSSLGHSLLLWVAYQLFAALTPLAMSSSTVL